MKRIKTLLLISFVAVIAFTGCEKDDVHDPLTSANYVKLNKFVGRSHAMDLLYC
jgi:hypothetical protein